MNEGRAQCAFILHFFLSTIFCCPRFFAPLVFATSGSIFLFLSAVPSSVRNRARYLLRQETCTVTDDVVHDGE